MTEYDAACQDKFKYTSEKAAKTVRRRMYKHHKGYKLVVYKCKYCHFWHIGNKEY